MKEGQEDEWGWAHSTGLHCAGRILLNGWRLMRDGGRGGGGCCRAARCSALPLLVQCKENERMLGTQLAASRPPAELKLQIYTFENCVAAVLQLRVPHVPHTQMHAWFSAGPGGACPPSRRLAGAAAALV